MSYNHDDQMRTTKLSDSEKSDRYDTYEYETEDYNLTHRHQKPLLSREEYDELLDLWIDARTYVNTAYYGTVIAHSVVFFYKDEYYYSEIQEFEYTLYWSSPRVVKPYKN